MATVYVTDADTGDSVAVDTVTPSGLLNVVDADTGEIVQVNLSNPTGKLNIIDRDDGEITKVDLSGLAGTVYLRDTDTGDPVEIALHLPSGLMYFHDSESGDDSQINLSTAGVIPIDGSLIPVRSPWFVSNNFAPIIAYNALGANSLDESYINLVNRRTYKLTEGTAPTLGADGWNFDGSTMYLETGYYPVGGQHSIFVRYSDLTSDSASPFGIFHNDETKMGVRRQSASMYSWNYSENPAFNSPALLSGVYGFSGPNIWRNGIKETESMTPTFLTYEFPWDIYVGAAHGFGPPQGSPVYYFAGKIQALVIFDQIISDAAATAVCTAMANL